MLFAFLKDISNVENALNSNNCVTYEIQSSYFCSMVFIPRFF